MSEPTKFNSSVSSLDPPSGVLWRREALSPDRLPYPVISTDTETVAADPLREPRWCVEET